MLGFAGGLGEQGQGQGVMALGAGLEGLGQEDSGTGARWGLGCGAHGEGFSISPARGPPLWDSGDALAGDGSQVGPDWDLTAQPEPQYEVDQRVNW